MNTGGSWTLEGHHATPARPSAPPRHGGALVSRFVCGWLGRRDVLASPFVRYTMAEVLHAFVSTDELYARHSRGFGEIDEPYTSEY